MSDSRVQRTANRRPLGDTTNEPPAPPAVSKGPARRKATPAQRAKEAEQRLAEVSDQNAALEEQLADTERKLRQAQADTLAAEGRLAAANTSAAAQNSRDTEQKIPRPQGKRWNLCDEMRLSDDKDLYNHLMTETRHITMQKLDRHKTYDKQDDLAMAKFCREVSKTAGLEYLRRFEGNWAAKEFAKTSLKSYRAQKRRKAGSSRSARRRSRSSSPDNTSDDEPGSGAEGT